MKIRPVGEELFHVDRRADVVKQIVAFRSCERSQNISNSATVKDVLS